MIYYKTCLEYSSSNNEVASSPNLIKAQVDKFITGTDIIKKSNFSDHVKKMVFQLDAVNGLNQLLEKPSGQTSVVNCVRGMNQISKDQLIMKLQLAHFTLQNTIIIRNYS